MALFQSGTFRMRGELSDHGVASWFLLPLMTRGSNPPITPCPLPLSLLETPRTQCTGHQDGNAAVNFLGMQGAGNCRLSWIYWSRAEMQSYVVCSLEVTNM